MRVHAFAALVTAFVSSASTSHAASLQVAPVSVEIQAPGAAATLTLRNEGTSLLNAQIRVFRWTQVNGQEKLEPTDDVVASPPIATLSPKTDYTLRLGRVTKRPVPAGGSSQLVSVRPPRLPRPAKRGHCPGGLCLLL